MKKILVFGFGLVLCFSGCASKVNITQQYVELNGKSFHYVFAESQNEAGVNHIVIDRFDEKGNLIARDSASNSGILHAVIPAVITGASTAGGLIGAAAVLRPDQTNITQTSGSDSTTVTNGSNTNTGNSGTNVSATSNPSSLSSTNTNIDNINTNSTSSTSNSNSSATAKNVNTNTNLNSNKNYNTNTNNNANLNLNSNKNTNSNYNSKQKNNNGCKR